MDFPISHWSSHEHSREHSTGQQLSNREEVQGPRKRLSLQNDVSNINKPCDEVSVAAQLIKRVKACKSL